MADESIPLKQCSRKEKCINPLGSLLPATVGYFYARKQGRLGLNSQCIVCDTERHRLYKQAHAAEHRAYSRRYHDEHPEWAKERKRAYHQKHREAIKIKRRAYSANNSARAVERATKWAKDHPERARAIGSASTARRRAQKRSTGGTVTRHDIELQLKSQRGKCWHCGKELNGVYHADHLIPLARGGSNKPENIVISCPNCNLRKSDKLPQEWNGRLF